MTARAIHSFAPELSLKRDFSGHAACSWCRAQSRGAGMSKLLSVFFALALIFVSRASFAAGICADAFQVESPLKSVETPFSAKSITPAEETALLLRLTSLEENANVANGDTAHTPSMIPRPFLRRKSWPLSRKRVRTS